jgi:hypothetical protein
MYQIHYAPFRKFACPEYPPASSTNCMRNLIFQSFHWLVVVGHWLCHQPLFFDYNCGWVHHFISSSVPRTTSMAIELPAYASALLVLKLYFYWCTLVVKCTWVAHLNSPFISSAYHFTSCAHLNKLFSAQLCQVHITSHHVHISTSRLVHTCCQVHSVSFELHIHFITSAHHFTSLAHLNKPFSAQLCQVHITSHHMHISTSHLVHTCVKCTQLHLSCTSDLSISLQVHISTSHLVHTCVKCTQLHLSCTSDLSVSCQVHNTSVHM